MNQENLIGVDVGAKELVAAIRRSGKYSAPTSFENNPAGHRKFIAWATKRGKKARVCLESTGVYSLEFALALHHSSKTVVMVLNPRAAKDFSRASMVRAKTDKVDAAMLLEFLERMEFKPWSPPSRAVLELQGICRRIVQLKVEMNREKNRAHAAKRLGGIGQSIAHDIELNIRHLRRRLKWLEEEGLGVVRSVPDLSDKFDRLVTIKGIGEASAMRILAELMVLPEGMRPEQWVAHAGLDPRPHESGTSIRKPRRITKAGNRYLRAALFMPALVAVRHEPNVRAFYEKLVARGKKPIQANVAVMRKLLHAIWGMLKNDEDFVGEKFYAMSNEG